MTSRDDVLHPDPGPAPRTDDLAALRQELPGFRIWREEMPSRARYVARAEDLQTHPYTVIAADPGELRAQLASKPGPAATGTVP